MDFYEATRIVFSRIQSVEPENVSKIIGYLLVQDHGDREMIRLAFGPDSLIQSMISKAKKYLALQVAQSSTTQLLSPYNYTPFSHVPSRSYPALSAQQTPYWDSQTHQESPLGNSHFSSVPIEQSTLSFMGRNSLQDQMFCNEKLHPLTFNEPAVIRDYNVQLHEQQLPLFENDSYINYPEMQIGSFNETKLGMDFFNIGTSKRPTQMADVKPCLYFGRGYCKHGSNCRFSHAENHLSVSVSASSSPSGSVNEEPISTGSLERLELELQELLRAKRAPISIASLPQLYYERYGRTLQAEGYLTESQRHGKAGYSLTKLLARLKNTVRLIDRPHGQHAVVLAEDAPRFTEYRSERNDIAAGLIAGSRQIYLTFPAESTFTEEDVSNYFRSYGHVQDVRIPYQQKRMFGFVTFVYPDTVKTILAKGNPHYVCGARVLVKPYREKGKHGDRKNAEKLELSKYMAAAYSMDMDYDFQLGGRIVDSSEIMRRQLLAEEQEQAIEMERSRLAEFHIFSQVSKITAVNNAIATQEQHSDFDDTKAVDQDLNDFSLTDHFSYLLEVLNSDSMNGEKPKNNNTNDQDSGHGHNLPDSPFTTPRASYAANNISAAT